MKTLNKVQFVLLIIAALAPVAMIGVLAAGIMDAPVTDYDLLYWIAIWFTTTVLWLFAASFDVDYEGYYIKDKGQLYGSIICAILLIILMFIL